MAKFVGLLMAVVFLMSALTSAKTFAFCDSDVQISSSTDLHHQHEEHTDEAPFHCHHHCFSCDRTVTQPSVFELSSFQFLESFGLSKGPSLHDDPDLHGPSEPPRA